jgi:hypothetical protein
MMEVPLLLLLLSLPCNITKQTESWEKSVSDASLLFSLAPISENWLTVCCYSSNPWLQEFTDHVICDHIIIQLHL